MPKGTPAEISSFHGGMNRKVSPLLVKLEEARLAKNVSLDEIGTIKKAKGYATFADAPDSNNVLALYSFYKIGTTTTRFFLRDSGGTIYKYEVVNEQDQWSALAGATGLDATVIPDWETYRNMAMRFNGVDNPKKFDGDTFADLGGNPPNGTIVTLYKDRIYVTGVDPNFSTVHFSATGNPENWPAFNNFDVNNNDGDRIIAAEPVFDSLMIFKEFSIWEYQVDAKNNPSVLRYVTLDVGTTSRRSVVNIGGVVYFFSRQGIYQFASRYPELISLKVQDFIDAITDPYGVVAFKDGYKYCLFIGDVTVGGKAYNKCVIVYDTLQDTWLIRTLGHAIKSVGTFIGADNLSKVYLGSTDGKTFEWGKGYSYANTPIEVEYETGPIQIGDPRLEKTTEEILVRTSNLPKSAPSVYYSVDGGQFLAPKGNLCNKTVNEFEVRQRFTDVALRFHEVSDKEMKEIYQAVVYYNETGGHLRKK